MQITDFPVEHIVHDDASSDGTAALVREYAAKHPGTIRPIFQESNVFSRGIDIPSTQFYPNARGKYIAFCEGDDYWTDPHKLQKQVDFLESNPRYGFCMGSVVYLHCDTGLSHPFPHPGLIDGSGSDLSLQDFLLRRRDSLLSLVFRKELIQGVDFSGYESKIIDIVIYSILLQKAPGKVFLDRFGVYRIHQGGMCSMASQEQRLLLGLDGHREIFLRNPRVDGVMWAYFEFLESLDAFIQARGKDAASVLATPSKLQHFLDDAGSIRGRIGEMGLVCPIELRRETPFRWSPQD
jgi:glycosyltransferase involved in cell wall biosynthesis